jgi:hypothetical protein
MNNRVVEVRASARKANGKYKAVILHPSFGAAIGKYRSEILGTRHALSEDGRDMVVIKGAPLYETRAEAMRVAQAVISRRARR